MSVKKSVLKEKTDRELEKYLSEENTYVPEAVEIAFEILKERGKTYTEEETKRIQQLVAKKQTQAEIEKVEEEVKEEKNKRTYGVWAVGAILLYVGYGLLENEVKFPTKRGSSIVFENEAAWSVFASSFFLFLLYLTDYIGQKTDRYTEEQIKRYKKLFGALSAIGMLAAILGNT
jgi:hypothetical protein